METTIGPEESVKDSSWIAITDSNLNQSVIAFSEIDTPSM